VEGQLVAILVAGDVTAVVVLDLLTPGASSHLLIHSFFTIPLHHHTHASILTTVQCINPAPSDHAIPELGYSANVIGASYSNLPKRLFIPTDTLQNHNAASNRAIH
jgi:hypothetical protein